MYLALFLPAFAFKPVNESSPEQRAHKLPSEPVLNSECPLIHLSHELQSVSQSSCFMTWVNSEHHILSALLTYKREGRVCDNDLGRCLIHQTISATDHDRLTHMVETVCNGELTTCMCTKTHRHTHTHTWLGECHCASCVLQTERRLGKIWAYVSPAHPRTHAHACTQTHSCASW